MGLAGPLKGPNVTNTERTASNVLALLNSLRQHGYPTKHTTYFTQATHGPRHVRYTRPRLGTRQQQCQQLEKGKVKGLSCVISP
jgi:hypothetical protein